MAANWSIGAGPAGAAQSSPSKSALRCRPLLEVLEARTVPSSFLVTNLNDSGGGSLRYEIQQANSAGGANTIDFAQGLSGTITLTSGELDLTSNMTINGPGNNKIAVSGDNSSRVLEVAAGAQVMLNDLSITDGYTSGFIGNNGEGGGILNLGSLTIRDCMLSGNSANNGGGICNFGSLTVSDSTLSGNSAAGGFGGGGIDNGGTLTIRDSILSGNSAQFGGGITNGISLTIRDSTLSGNSAGYGGGIYNAVFSNSSGTVTVSNSFVIGNTAANSGGGVFNQGSLTVSSSIMYGNSAGNDGGGIYNSHGAVTVRNSFVTGNSAANGGGIYTIGDTLSLVGDNLIFGNSPNNIVYG